MVVHSALPPLLEAAVAEELGAAGIAQVGHGDGDTNHMVYGAEEARRTARLIAEAGVSDRAELVRTLRASGAFDEHGDPVDPAVWLWRADASWVLRADRPL